MNQLSNSLKNRQLLVLVAHYDDEALFCGGTLLRARDMVAKMTIAVVSAVHFTNASPQGTDARQEETRQRTRLHAFASVCQELGADGIHLGCRNLHSHGTDPKEVKVSIREEVEPILQEALRCYGDDVVLTHGPDGEYGSPQHKLVHQLSMKHSKAKSLWCFGRDSDVPVRVSWPEKRKLLDLYKVGGTPSGRWDPEDFPEYRTWCCDVEHFTCVA